MIKKLEKYVKRTELGLIKVAAYCGYSDTAPIRNWIRRQSIPKHMELRLRPLLLGEKSVEIQIKQG